jgi:hypothetical protein
MGKALPPNVLGGKGQLKALRSNVNPEVHALKQENARLRELVIQLSELVIKNIIDNIEDGCDPAEN